LHAINRQTPRFIGLSRACPARFGFPKEKSARAPRARVCISCPQAGTVEILNLHTWKLQEHLKLTPWVDGLGFLASTN